MAESGGLRGDRVVMVWAAGRPGTVGTGYLVGPDAVLTAWHVVGQAASSPPSVPSNPSNPSVPSAFATPAGIQIRRLRDRRSENPYIECRVVWSSAELDVALLRPVVAGAAADVPEVSWGALSLTEPVDAHAVGFPDYRRDGSFRRPDQVELKALPLGLDDGRLALDVRSSIGGDAPSRGGLSGGPVFAADRLIAVLLTVPGAAVYEARRFYARPVAALWADPGFRAAAAGVGLEGRVRRLGSRDFPGAARTEREFVDLLGRAVRTPPIPDEWRGHLLAAVRDQWTSKSLEQSFRDAAVRLEVVCREAPYLVDDDPWAVDDGWPATPTAAAVGAAAMLADDVYERFLEPRVNARLLVAGAPGAGKTTMLLALARLINERAGQERTAPVGLPLLLQQWRDPDQGFGDWVVDAIAKSYSVPPPLVTQWLAAGGITLVLDGLDEIPGGPDDGRMRRIDTFLKDPGSVLTGVLISSREAEYRDRKPLFMDHAVQIQPVDRNHVLSRLEHAHEDYRVLRTAIERGDPVAEILDSPLMVGIAAVALRDLEPDDPRMERPFAQDELFDRYLEALLRRPRGLRSRVGTMHRRHAVPVYRKLVMIARLLVVQKVNVFIPDWITPDWIPAGYASRDPTSGPRTSRRATVGAMLVPIAVFAAISLPPLLACGILALGPGRGVEFAAVGAAVFGLGRGFQTHVEPAFSIWVWSWRQARNGVLYGLGMTVAVCLIGAWMVTFNLDHTVLSYGLVVLVIAAAALLTQSLGDNRRESALGVAVGLVLGFAVGAAVGGVHMGFGTMQQVLYHPSFMQSLRDIGSAVPGTFVHGTNVGVIAGLVGAYAAGPGGGLVFGFVFGVAGAGPGGLAMCAVFGLAGGIVPDRTAAPAAPNGALRASRRAVALLAAAFVVLAAIALTVTVLVHGRVRTSCAILLAVSVLLSGAGPGRDWLAHWTSRWSLAVRRVLPWALNSFLVRQASERALLARAGGGFRFVHPTFLAYLAGRGENDLGDDARLAARTIPDWRPEGHPGTDSDVLRRWWEVSGVRQSTVLSAGGVQVTRGLHRLWPIAVRWSLAAWLGTVLGGFTNGQAEETLAISGAILGVVLVEYIRWERSDEHWDMLVRSRVGRSAVRSVHELRRLAVRILLRVVLPGGFGTILGAYSHGTIHLVLQIVGAVLGITLVEALRRQR
ncbi:MAG: NACHT domain-containing protein [Catenulispora sp.]|nr:NACHT domain-containing protein [Catenulispora sp.]